MISTFSGKSIFGYIGSSLIKVPLLTKQTICRKINEFCKFILLNTPKVFKVKILVTYDNPQITKARGLALKLGIKEFSKLSMWVGISEAIRLLPTFSINQIYWLKLFKYSLSFLWLEYKNKSTDNYYNLVSSAICAEASPCEGLESEPLRLLAREGSERDKRHKENEERFYEWVAGIIDGDGCFLLSKKGYASLEVVTQLRDKKCLYLIKQKLGGAVKLYSGDNYLRYRLHHKEGLLKLIEKVNGLLQNPTRILQLGKICDKYNIELKDPKPLTYYNGWLAGFFDTDGSIYYNEASGQIFITATQKNRFLLEALVKFYGGTIYPMVKQEAFKWTCFKKKEVLSLVNDYFKVNPCRSKKLVRIHMVNKFFELRKLHAHKATPNSDLGKAWKHYLIEWNSFIDK